jgi:GTP-binding protein
MEVKFVKSSNDYITCPKNNLPEIAFIGRSNVGKSSLINLITGIKNLAKTSSKPGKTKLINHFVVDQKWYLVDLPGFGYASASKSDIKHFDELVRGYILTRANLYCLLVLIDSRLQPQKKDFEFLDFLGQNKIPFVLIFTKTDKTSPILLEKNIADFKKNMLQTWEVLPTIFKASAIKKTGKDEILKFIYNTIHSTVFKYNK